MKRWMHCRVCGDDIAEPTGMLSGLCWDCREDAAKEVRSTWCVAPMHKSNYVLITQRSDLAGLNNKGRLVK